MQDPESKPRLETYEAWLWQVFCGMCMGAADLVPGISGGTIAFIMGIYQGLIGSLKTFKPSVFMLLFQLRFKAFFNALAWEFLLALIIGASISFFMFAELFDEILNHEMYRVRLYSAFMGLILASTYFCAKEVKQWEWKSCSFLVLGGLIAFALTGTDVALPTLESEYEGVKGSTINITMMVCGAIAICAMLLPGVSGSYLLTILGVYPTVIGALADFTRGLKSFELDSDAFFILLSLALGIMVGAICFARILSWVLKYYHDLTVALLTGFMIGALRSVWPYWTYTYKLVPLRIEKGPQIMNVDPLMPDLSAASTWISFAFLLVGFAIVFAVSALAKIKVAKSENLAS